LLHVLSDGAEVVHQARRAAVGTDEDVLGLTARSQRVSPMSRRRPRAALSAWLLTGGVAVRLPAGCGKRRGRGIASGSGALRGGSCPRPAYARGSGAQARARVLA